MNTQRGSTSTADRLALALGLLAYVGVLVWVALTGRDPLPAHLGADGEPTRWASKTWVLGSAAAAGAVLLVVVLGCRTLASRASPKLLSLPSASAEDCWTTPERRPELNRRLRADLELIFGSTFLLLAAASAAVCRGSSGRSAPWHRCPGCVGSPG